MLARTYGNGVTREYAWSAKTRALTGLSTSFSNLEATPDANGKYPSVNVQDDTFTRDVMGRIVTSTAAGPVIDGTTVTTDVTAECFRYDGFNRLSGAWTVADTSPATCGTEAPADASATGWDASATAYAATWTYSNGGRITSLVKGAGVDAVTNTYSYDDAAHPAAVTDVTSDAPAPEGTPVVGVSDDFESNTYAGGTGSGWSGEWVESQDDASATDDTGLVFVANGMLHLRGSGVDFATPGVTRTVDVTDAASGTLNLGVLSGDTALNSGDVLTVKIMADGDPTKVITQVLSGGNGYPTVADETAPPTAVAESVDVSSLLPVSSLEVSVFIDEGDGTNNTTSPGAMFLIQDMSVDLTGTTAAPLPVGPDAFTYDDAGRMESRTVDGVTTALTWDVTSSLVESDGQGGHVVYA
jgi:hypothetical protein